MGRVERTAGRPVRRCEMGIVGGLLKRPDDYLAPACPGIEVEGVTAAAGAAVRAEGALRSGVLVVDVEEPAAADEGRRMGLPDTPRDPMLLRPASNRTVATVVVRDEDLEFTVQTRAAHGGAADARGGAGLPEGPLALEPWLSVVQGR
jgi:hypothetical protein